MSNFFRTLFSSKRDNSDVILPSNYEKHYINYMYEVVKKHYLDEQKKANVVLSDDELIESFSTFPYLYSVIKNNDMVMFESKGDVITLPIDTAKHSTLKKLNTVSSIGFVSTIQYSDQENLKYKDRKFYKFKSSELLIPRSYDIEDILMAHYGEYAKKYKKGNVDYDIIHAAREIKKRLPDVYETEEFYIVEDLYHITTGNHTLLVDEDNYNNFVNIITGQKDA